MDFAPKEIEIDVYRSGDKTTAVRVTHLPTGVSVFVDDQPTREQNYKRALQLLRETLSR